MKHSFLFDLDARYIVVFLFFAMLLAINVGYRFGVKKTKTDSDNSGILSSLLGLLALILAFTFGMSGSRFETRKASLIDEANCIGTAILRADTYPDSLKNVFKKILPFILAPGLLILNRIEMRRKSTSLLESRLK